MSRYIPSDSFANRILLVLSQKSFFLRKARPSMGALPWSRYYRQLPLFLGLLLVVACTPKQTQGGGGNKAECGECLDMPTGEVCTVHGTRRNSCMAICENAKILCFEACPCPEEK